MKVALVELGKNQELKHPNDLFSSVIISFVV